MIRKRITTAIEVGKGKTELVPKWNREWNSDVNQRKGATEEHEDVRKIEMAGEKRLGETGTPTMEENLP